MKRQTDAEIILNTLAGYKINAEIKKVTAGPTVTRYEIKIPKDVPASAVLKRDGELAMRLGCLGVRAYENFYEDTVCLEVPNPIRERVELADLLQDETYLNEKGRLMFPIGKDVDGKTVCGDLRNMRHILAAGCTGAGKVEFLHTMIAGLTGKYSPEELRLLLVDPIQVDFACCSVLPHLLTGLITEPCHAAGALNWAIKEMERRYCLFSDLIRAGRRVWNIEEYNQYQAEKLPYIVIVVSELAYLMAAEEKAMEERIQRLAQKSRAAGIHLVLATNRPTASVLAGTVLANLPTRIAFRTVNARDSMRILDEAGAEKLLGMGDMLLKTEWDRECARIQGARVSREVFMEIVEATKAKYGATEFEALYGPMEE